MSPPSAARRLAAAEEVARLRERIERLERTTRPGADSRVLPAPPTIAELLPGRGLRTGTAYALDRSMALLTGLLAEPSRAGTWCAAIGFPELGIEAVRAAGAELERLVLIPRPGERWLSVVATVAEVMGLVAVRPSGPVRDRDAARLAARLRERGTVLLVQGPWPQAEAVIGVEAAQWSGLGDGHGHLERLEATIAVTARQSPRVRRGRTVLLGPAGGGLGTSEAAQAAATDPAARGTVPAVGTAEDAAAPATPLRAVG